MEIYHSAWWIPSTWWILHGYGSLLECQLLTLSPINKVESVENDHFGDKQLIFQGPGISTKITKLSLNHDYRRNGKWKKNVLPKMKKMGGWKKHLAKLWMTPTPTLLFWANKSYDSEFDKSSGAAWELKGEARIFARLLLSHAILSLAITSPLRNWCTVTSMFGRSFLGWPPHHS